MRVCPTTGDPASIASDGAYTGDGFVCSQCGASMGIHEMNAGVNFKSHTKAIHESADWEVIVDRVTMIDNEKEEQASGGRVIYDGAKTHVVLPEAEVAGWLQTGSELVAAHSNGNVETSLTVQSISHPCNGYVSLSD